jgi:hypothetical protein
MYFCGSIINQKGIINFQTLKGRAIEETSTF